MEAMANKKNRIGAKQSNKLILLVFRIILGIILFAKGISFLRDKALLENLISNSITEEKFSIVGLLIPYIHIAGGFFIIIGLYIRVSILIQLPIIIGAIILLLESGGKPYQGEILFATLILIMLLVQLVYGDGLYSWRNLLNKEKNIT
jgi:uncharacterized membrane protein YphA (DoxX/SURF4 family)